MTVASGRPPNRTCARLVRYGREVVVATSRDQADVPLLLPQRLISRWLPGWCCGTAVAKRIDAACCDAVRREQDAVDARERWLGKLGRRHLRGVPEAVQLLQDLGCEPPVNLAEIALVV